MKCSLAIINKNDCQGAEQIVPRIDRSLFSDIFAVDGGSMDGSPAFFEAQGIELQVVQTGGRGGALRYAAQHARGDYIVYLSTDGEEDPRDLPKFIKAFEEGADMAIASRTAKGGRHKAQQKHYYYHRLLFLKFVTMMINILFGSRLTDCWNGYRGFRLVVLREVTIDAEDFMVEAQQTIRFLKKGYRIVEFPTYEGARIAGRSSNPIWKSGWLHLVMLYEEKFGKCRDTA